jgi:hypothetical protein
MKTHVTFRCDQFLPDGEDRAMPSPEPSGKRAADFLAAGLRGRGFEPHEPIAEDWGWVIPIRNERFDLWVGCGKYGDHPDGFLCFIEPHRPTIRRLFRKMDTSEPVLALGKALDEILSANPAIKDVAWSTYEKFNCP